MRVAGCSIRRVAGIGLGRSLTALTGLHTLDLSGEDSYNRVLHAAVCLLILIHAAGNLMHKEAAVAVMQSLAALTGLQMLNLSSEGSHDFFPIWHALSTASGFCLADFVVESCIHFFEVSCRMQSC